MSRSIRVYTGWVLQAEYPVDDLTGPELAEYERWIESGLPEGWDLVGPDDIDDEDDSDEFRWTGEAA